MCFAKVRAQSSHCSDPPGRGNCCHLVETGMYSFLTITDKVCRVRIPRKRCTAALSVGTGILWWRLLWQDRTPPPYGKACAPWKWKMEIWTEVFSQKAVDRDQHTSPRTAPSFDRGRFQRLILCLRTYTQIPSAMLITLRRRSKNS